VGNLCNSVHVQSVFQEVPSPAASTESLALSNHAAMPERNSQSMEREKLLVQWTQWLTLGKPSGEQNVAGGPTNIHRQLEHYQPERFTWFDMIPSLVTMQEFIAYLWVWLSLDSKSFLTFPKFLVIQIYLIIGLKKSLPSVCCQQLVLQIVINTSL